MKELPDAAKDQHNKTKEQNHKNQSTNSNELSRQGKNKEFRRHRVVDRPVLQLGTSQQLHQLHSFKTCSEPQQHERPPICKQYQWKPYPTEQKERYRQLMAMIRKERTKKKLQRAGRQHKRQMELTKKPPPPIKDLNKS
ncbi:hypothetical protein FBU30_004097 [Linnemannia zychae]|nr:hypothetical protein FBU30_004097 [Linnemannia zychae]